MALPCSFFFLSAALEMAVPRDLISMKAGLWLNEARSLFVPQLSPVLEAAQPT